MAASSTAVLFIDVDGLKQVNDHLGHLAGDEVLVHVARVLRDCARPGDTLARLGGDEFGVLAERLVHSGDATALAEAILASLRKSVASGHLVDVISVSIGIAFTEPGCSYLEVLGRADEAMYLAKRSGRGRFEVHAEVRSGH